MKLPRLAPFAVLFALSGCLLDSTTNGDGVSYRQPDDIPIPHGMKLLDTLHQSHTLVESDYRFANLVYEGTNSLTDVSAFLQERMPNHSHKLVRKTTKNGNCEVLVFKRGRYTSECTVRRLEFTTKLEIKIRTDQNLP